MKRQRIAVLGGGMGSLAAVFAITSQPGWSEKFEITLYQMGFRLGGKGASGRNLDTPGQNRIEEHGLHIWLGHYENAFTLMRACYAELAQIDPSCQAWSEAFRPFHDVALMERHDEQWKSWPVPDMSLAGTPGDGEPLPFPLRHLFSHRPAAEVERMAELYNLVTSASRMVRAIHAEGGDADAVAIATAQHAELESGLQAWFGVLRTTPSEAENAWRVGPQRLMQAREQSLNAAGLPSSGSALDWVRRARIGWNLARSMAGAIVADRLLQRGYQAVDDYDFAAYLQQHGATRETVESAVVRGAYELAFAFRAGDIKQPAFAAGTGVRCMLLLAAGCKGALFWKMQGGMGDIVFAPLYQVLRQRGVKVEFFHTARKLTVTGQRVSSITLSRQAHLTAGRDSYDPLATLQVGERSLRVWPNRPLWEQLDFDPAAHPDVDFESPWRAPPDVESRTLRDGEDFDAVILGVSLAEVGVIAGDLAAANPRFQRMLQHVETVQTQALQLWFEPTTAELGWTQPPPVLDGFAEPFDTWADMSHLLHLERWTAKPPGSCAYLCSVLPEEAATPGVPFDVQLRESVRKNAVAWLGDSSRYLWPHASTSLGFRWELLRAPEAAGGEARLETQYYRANVSKTERYVLTVPGSTKFRLRAEESGFENCVLAGDWLRTGLSAGCIEGASMGGLQAAAAITGRALDIVRDDEP